MKTFAAVLENIKPPLKIMELEVPLIKGQVWFKSLIAVFVFEILGHKGEDKYLPSLDHEGSG